MERKIVFVCFDPWAIGHNKHKLMTEKIINEGFELLAFNYRQLTESDVEYLYRKNRPIGLTTSWHVPRAVYQMGMSCGIIFYMKDAGNGNKTATDRLKELKGRADPLLNHPGHLRFDFRAPNISLSLIHTADDWTSTLSESMVFFPGDFLRKKCKNINENISPVSREKFLNSCYFDGLERIEEQSAVSLLLKLRLRIVEKLLLEFPNIRVEPLIQLWSEKLAGDFLSYSVHEEAIQYLDFVQQETPLVKNLISNLKPYETSETFPRWYKYSCPIKDLVNAIMVLNDVTSYTYINADVFIRKVPVFCDKWEELLFKTTLFHFNDLIRRRDNEKKNIKNSDKNNQYDTND